MRRDGHADMVRQDADAGADGERFVERRVGQVDFAVFLVRAPDCEAVQRFAGFEVR